MAGNLGRFCTDTLPPDTLPLTQCAALTVSTDGSQVQRAELGTAHRAARPYSKLPSCAMCRVGRCRGCRQCSPGGTAQTTIVWPSPTRVEQAASSADDGVRLAFLCATVLYLSCFNGARAGEAETIPARSFGRSVRESCPRKVNVRITSRRGTEPIVGRLAGSDDFHSVGAAPRNGAPHFASRRHSAAFRFHDVSMFHDLSRSLTISHDLSRSLTTLHDACPIRVYVGCSRALTSQATLAPTAHPAHARRPPRHLLLF